MRKCRSDERRLAWASTFGGFPLTADAIVQARIDADIEARAAVVLDGMGLTVSDAVRILLTRVANEGALPFGFATDPEAHDAWFRAKIREALDDSRPAIPYILAYGVTGDVVRILRVLHGARRWPDSHL